MVVLVCCWGFDSTCCWSPKLAVGTVGIINILKGIVQLITILPPANGGEACWASNFSEDQLEAVRSQPFYMWFFMPWGTAHGCNDMIWSGHTANSTLGFLFMNVSLSNMGVSAMWRSLLIVYGIFYVAAVSAMRMHYTVDVIVAFLISTVLFTHTDYRNWLWGFVNRSVGNEKDPVPQDPPPSVESQEEEERGQKQGLLSILRCSR
eukprot:TRINITY_DN10042_c0_g1_i1.p1 TRINITY_DN10042_c0_g1~~TRINITY_DN10042_c0_g1_i1.p1  ORF type:complete len:206 (+),score=12.15 TRINITY_DN10042_c0_g1_i1:599-1216(+)